MLEDNFQTLLDRIKLVLETKTDADTAKRLEITPQALSHFKKQGRFPYELLIKFCFKNQVVIDWLLTGEGAKSRWELKALEEKVCESAEGYNATRMPVYALAGAGLPWTDTDYEPVDQIFVPSRFYKPSIRPIKVCGRSMEQTIMDGAIVGIDREDKWIVSGEIYAVWLPYEGAVIKRLFVHPDQIILRSDNPEFPEFAVPVAGLDENFVQGRVKWVVQML